jgi:hypothetical protein
MLLFIAISELFCALSVISIGKLFFPHARFARYGEEEFPNHSTTTP